MTENNKQTPETGAKAGGASRRRPRSKAAAAPSAERTGPILLETAPPIQTPVGASEKPRSTTRRRSAGGRGSKGEKPPLRIIPLGGLEEIGKNLTVIEYENDMFLIDCGMAFPDDDMPGIDLVLPDFTYLVQNKDRLRGVVLTHGHEDHIGGLAYLLKQVNIPVYGARLTIGLVEGKLKEHGLLRSAKLHVVKPGDVVEFGCMSVEFINVNHSIPDACGLAIFTPVGTLVHTGDFKIDYTPIDGEMMDLGRLGELGRQGVLALMADSTNAERPGCTPSESKVGETFETLFKRAEGRRIIVASFSSNVHRVQQIVIAAQNHGRKVIFSGRSMENVAAKAMELGYLKAEDGTIVDMDSMRRYPPEQVVLITTGSQGEPMSALSRMAMGEHRRVSVVPGDYIIISATPIPGNEKTVGRVINELMKLGADVVYESSMGLHVSGHACRDDIKLVIGLTKPRYYIPVHGEYKHLMKNAGIAMEMGIPPENIIIGEIGLVIEAGQREIKAVSSVPSGSVMVDGLGVGDVGSVVMRDRKHLSEDGLIVVAAAIDRKSGALLAGPDLVSRGFVYVRESESLMNEARQVCRQAIMRSLPQGEPHRDWGDVKQQVKDQLGQFLFNKTKRRPMILPIFQEV